VTFVTKYESIEPPTFVEESPLLDLAGGSRYYILKSRADRTNRNQ
jgi:hypothetical protein